MKYAKFSALRMIKVPLRWRRILWNGCLTALFCSTWGLIALSPWWYPSDMTPLEICGIGAAIFAAVFVLSPIMQWAVRRVKRPLKQRRIKMKYDPRGGKCDRERLGYI